MQPGTWRFVYTPGSKAHIFQEAEGGGHFMFMENPEKFNALVMDFLG